MKYDIFICNSRRDNEIAETLVTALTASGFKCCRDQNIAYEGFDFVQSIINTIDQSKLFLCILTEKTYQSSFVMNELQYALRTKEKGMILPVIADDSKIPQDLAFIHSLRINPSTDDKGILIKNVAEKLKKKDNSTDYRPQQVDVDIFVSYRKIDGRDCARSLMQGLKLIGYSNIFFDYHSIRDGKFNTQIIDAIYSCKDFILLLSPLAIKNCAQTGDWVATEIRTAIKYNKKIIPIIIDGEFSGWPKDFPHDLHPIKDIQFHNYLTNEYFEDSINKLADRLTSIASANNQSLYSLSKETTNQPDIPTPILYHYKLKVDRKCRLLIDDEDIEIIEPNTLYKISLPQGEYIRKLVDIQNDQIFNENILVLDHDKAELIRL